MVSARRVIRGSLSFGASCEPTTTSRQYRRILRHEKDALELVHARESRRGRDLVMHDIEHPLADPLALPVEP